METNVWEAIFLACYAILFYVHHHTMKIKTSVFISKVWAKCIGQPHSQEAEFMTILTKLKNSQNAADFSNLTITNCECSPEFQTSKIEHNRKMATNN